MNTTEHTRLAEAKDKIAPWKFWGPYLSERQWGTVREDYSSDGSAWDYFPHDHARSRAYRWGEDGLGGISDEKQRLCFALALWNGKDPIIKERLFGLTNSEQVGTKAAAHFTLNVPAKGSISVQLRLCKESPTKLENPFGENYEQIFTIRNAEADEFYQSIAPTNISNDEQNVFRQALSGMLWSKQYYFFDIYKWLREHNDDPFTSTKSNIRNRQWFHMLNDDIISMPDKWEYPWYAAWDLAFHTYTLALVDFDFAKEQLDLMLSELYLHPNGQIPAYEWNFGDVNPPVHAIVTLQIYLLDKEKNGQEDIAFLKSSFDKLLLNFTWWVNRKDRTGKNVFEGGFLGMDNIGIFDRSAQLPTGGFLEQADGTAWMALYAQNMLEISMELALHDANYENMILKFAEHFLWIASAMDRIGDNRDEMWDEKDGFFYDVLRYPDGNAEKLKTRSMVGLLPFCATTIIEPKIRDKFPHLLAKLQKRLANMPQLKASNKIIGNPGYQDRGMLTLVDEDKLRKILSRLLDEKEFLGDFGIRSLSRFHEKEPFRFFIGRQEFKVEYEPGNSQSGLFGGNSNWRGPIWMPVNMLILRALRQYYLYFGDAFKVECPVGSGKMMNLYEVSEEISRRLVSIFLRDKNGQRPVYGSSKKFQEDPYWKDLILFYEFFHGNTGIGLGASHQTGWTGLVARFIQVYGEIGSKEFLQEGRKGVTKKG